MFPFNPLVPVRVAKDKVEKQRGCKEDTSEEPEGYHTSAMTTVGCEPVGQNSKHDFQVKQTFTLAED